MGALCMGALCKGVLFGWGDGGLVCSMIHFVRMLYESAATSATPK